MVKTLTRHAGFFRLRRGVTLIELMNVVAILGILAAVAYPAYLQHATKARRIEAKTALLKVAMLQERYYLQNNRYTADMTNLGFGVPANAVTSSGTYVVNVTTTGSNEFSANAVYQKSNAELGKCATFTIDGRGSKGSAPYADCWTNSRR